MAHTKGKPTRAQIERVRDVHLRYKAKQILGEAPEAAEEPAAGDLAVLIAPSSSDLLN